MEKSLTLKLLDKTYAVCSLHKNENISDWMMKGEFLSITKTEDELSVVCKEDNVPTGIKFEGNWKILKIEGPLEFSLVGILSRISSILAEKNISIFAISTYDTDYILIKNNNIDKAIEALKNKNYNII